MNIIALMNVNTIALIMIWLLSGLFVAFLMRMVDDSRDYNYKGPYWIKGHNYMYLSILILVLCAPLSLLISIVVMGDYCSKK